MSAKTLELIEKVKQRFDNAVAKKDSITSHDISQYNVTIDGKIVKTIVINLKDFVFLEEAAENEIEITLDDQYVLGVFSGQVFLEDLKKAGKIEVKGDESLIKVLDERSKKYAAAAAAAKQ